MGPIDALLAEQQAIFDMVKDAREAGLLIEVLDDALAYGREQPTTTLSECLRYGVRVWDL